jgi:hypothetical protein
LAERLTLSRCDHDHGFAPRRTRRSQRGLTAATKAIRRAHGTAAYHEGHHGHEVSGLNPRPPPGRTPHAVTLPSPIFTTRTRRARTEGARLKRTPRTRAARVEAVGRRAREAVPLRDPTNGPEALLAAVTRRAQTALAGPPR